MTENSVEVLLIIQFIQLFTFNFALRGGPHMNLYIDLDKFEIGSYGMIKGSGDLTSLINCYSCVRRQRCVSVSNPNSYKMFAVIFCTRWRPKYELVY